VCLSSYAHLDSQGCRWIPCGSICHRGEVTQHLCWGDYHLQAGDHAQGDDGHDIELGHGVSPLYSGDTTGQPCDYTTLKKGPAYSRAFNSILMNGSLHIAGVPIIITQSDGGVVNGNSNDGSDSDGDEGDGDEGDNLHGSLL